MAGGSAGNTTSSIRVVLIFEFASRVQPSDVGHSMALRVHRVPGVLAIVNFQFRLPNEMYSRRIFTRELASKIPLN